MSQQTLEIIGYSASIIIAISMTMSSIVKFRVINLVGASLFCIYGILIGAVPVAILNGFIVVVDIYYLNKIFSTKEVFEILQVRSDNRYLLRFLRFHHVQIQRFFPGFAYDPDQNTVSFFVLRDMAVAGVFLARQHGENGLLIDLDYVIPEYRDFKNARYVYVHLRGEFLKAGYDHVVSLASSKAHRRYLERIGFISLESNKYIMYLGQLSG